MRLLYHVLNVIYKLVSLNEYNLLLTCLGRNRILVVAEIHVQ